MSPALKLVRDDGAEHAAPLGENPASLVSPTKPDGGIPAVTESEVIALENVSLRVQVKLLASDKEHLSVQLRALSSQLQLYHDRAGQEGATPVVRRSPPSMLNLVLVFCAGVLLGYALFASFEYQGEIAAKEGPVVFTH